MYVPSTLWTWMFMGIATAQAVIILALESYVFAQFQIDINTENGVDDSGDVAKAISTFLALYIFGFLYSLVLVYDALRMKNTIQAIGLVLLNVGLLIYGAVQYDTINDAVQSLTENGQIDDVSIWPHLRPILIAIPCALAVTTIMMAVVAWKLYDEFAWSIYKHISADLRMKRRYLTFQIYIALLKFDFFFFLGFTIQFVVIVHGRVHAEFGLTIAAIPVTILILFAAGWFTRREILLGCLAILLFFFAGLAYFIFKLYRMYEPGYDQPYLSARKELTAFAVITILLIVITIVYQILCMLNFGKGLKPYVTSSAATGDEEKTGAAGRGSAVYSGRNSYAGYGPGVEMISDWGKPGRAAPTRMEID